MKRWGHSPGDHSSLSDREEELTEFSKRSGMTRRQLVIWAGQQFALSSSVYNALLVWTLEGNILPQTFQEAFQDVVDSSDALRSSIFKVDGEPRRQVREHLLAAMECVDLSAGAESSAKWRK